jgi:serine/threonine protein kinase
MIGSELGNYHVLEMIGKGGMAVVYKGQHKTLSRRVVAIKMLSASLESDASFSERFFREAEVMDRLRHPNIVTLYDFIEEEGHYYIVMEYVAGKTLSEIIKEADSPLSNDEISAVFQQVLAGIGHAHSLGIIHRDLKPGNIMINEEGEVKITDFGIARLLGNNFETTLTTTGMGIGSPYYMSPEQVLASKDHPITGASDIYSLGITLYQMATGRLPFEGEESLFNIMQSHVKKPPPPPREIVPGISKPLEAVILKSIQKKAEERWPSCEAFWQALGEALADPLSSDASRHATQNAPVDFEPPMVGALPESSKKNKWAARLIILLLVAALAGVGGFFFVRQQPVSEDRPVTEEMKSDSVEGAKQETFSKEEKTTREPVARKTVQKKSMIPTAEQVGAGGKQVEKTRQQTERETKEKAVREKDRQEINQLVEQAEAFLGLKEYDRARDTAGQVLKREPANLKARDIYTKAEKEKKAADERKAARERERKKKVLADKTMAQAEAHFAAKQYQLAATETSAVLKSYPKDPRALKMKKKLEDLARVLEKRRQIALALQNAEAALEQKRYTRAKLIAQRVLDVEPENKRAKRVVQLAEEGEENKMLTDMMKGFLPSGGGDGISGTQQDVPDGSGGDELPQIPQGFQDQSSSDMPSIPLPSLSGQ